MPFADITRWGLAAAPALAALRVRGHVIAVFSVGPRAWLEDLAASYRELVDDIGTSTALTGTGYPCAGHVLGPLSSMRVGRLGRAAGSGCGKLLG